MPLRIYNTITRSEEIFKPLNPPKVTMYVCGITPYDEAHLGHGRAYVAFDVIRRYLEYSGYKVNYIQNITDIDDKIINRANDRKISIQDLTKQYSDNFFSVMDQLNVKRASSYPKATDHIKDMVKVIEGLVKKGFAYVVDGDVLFEVKKFKDYGKLSNRKLEDMEAGARVRVDKKKRNPLDFVLWKTSKEGEPNWDSPWGKGRPGWHIECSTMSNKYLGETFDIHGGGLDLIFPHHENEIAQAEASTGKQFVKYWMHNGFVNINKEKMSKSLGNFFTLKDIYKKYKPEVVRFFLLSTHYRHPINFSDEQLNDAVEALMKIKEAINDLELYQNSAPNKKTRLKIKIEEFKNKFISAMDSDFNAAKAIGSMFELINYSYEQIKLKSFSKDDINLTLKILNEFLSIIGVMEKKEEIPENIQKKASERDKARKNKDFKRADTLRLELEREGYIVKDTPYGTSLSGSVSLPSKKGLKL